MDKYSAETKVLSWSAQSLLLLASVLPLLLTSLGARAADDAVFPGMAAGYHDAFYTWVIPLVVMVAFLFVDRSCRFKESTAFDQAVITGTIGRIKFQGKHRPVDGSRVSDDEQSTVMMCQDVSEKDHMQKEVQKASYLITVGEMAAGVAHEIRNPLAVISGYTQLLREKPPDLTLGEVRHYLDVLQGEIEHLNRIVNDFVTLAAPSNLICVSVSLNDLVDEVQEFLQSEARRLDIALISDLEPSLPKIKGDPSRLRGVLFNLIGNAFQAVGPGGRVVLRTFRDRGKICLAIEDNGPGIPESLQEKIFVPFFSTKDTGTGAGLAVSQRIVANHGGSLICSSRPGKTVFTVRLPLEH